MVDMFATKMNNKLPLYVSRVPDPNAMAVDALNILWEALDGYAYCPVALIPKLIQKMRTYAYRMIVVARGRPGMSWFWDLIELSTKPPLLLQHWETLLKQPFCQRFTRIFNISTFMFGTWTRDQNFSKILSQWQRELRHLEDFHPEGSMNQGGQFLNHGARRIRWTSTNLLCPDFLAYLFSDKKLKPTTIAGYRMAIADHLGSDFDISKNLELNRLLASFHRNRPGKDKAIPNWDLSLVLLALNKPPFEPVRKASLKILTFKTVSFMTLASGRRRGEVHAWTFRSLKHRTGWKEVTVSPSSVFLAKNQPASDGPEIVQPVVIPALKHSLDHSMSADMTVCPVRALRYYLDKTTELRENKPLLFISFKDGFSKDIQRSTISSWLKLTVVLAYESSDVETQTLSNVKAHDVRYI